MQNISKIHVVDTLIMSHYSEEVKGIHDDLNIIPDTNTKNKRQQ